MKTSWRRRRIGAAAGIIAAALLGSAGALHAGAGNAVGEPPTPPEGGYRIWFDGAMWHLRGVAGEAKARRFHGVLTVPGGASDVKNVPEKLSARLANKAGTLRFEFSGTGQVGLDFAAKEARCLVLELMVDDRHQPQLVRIGQHGVTPPLFPYEACR